MSNMIKAYSVRYKEELKKINTELAGLYLQFNKNLLNSTNAFELVVAPQDSIKLGGLPASSIAVAAEALAQQGRGAIR